MDFNIEVRKKQLDNLDQLISSSRKRVQSVLSYLGWSEEKVKKEEPLVQCPINPHHRICPKSWNQHIEKCIIKIEGYDLKSQFLSESLDNPTQSIQLDHSKKVEVVTKALNEKGPLRLAWNGLEPEPRTADRWTSTYSPDERLLFYNYSVENTVGPPVPPEFTTVHNKQQEQEKPISYEEILSQQRDAKRRRAKYKSVHINRKNHTEVIREVIDGQMEEYKEWLSCKEQTNNTEECNNDNGIEEEREEERKEEQERPHSSISKTSNHSSSSRSTSRRYDHHHDRREVSRDQYNSRYYERRNKYERDRHDHRRSSEERWYRNNHSNERKRSQERERRHSSRDRNRRSYDNMKKN